MIDYTVHSPLHEYLIKHHSQKPFNAIIDIVGIQDLHTHCPEYLAKDGLFDLVGAIPQVTNPSWIRVLYWLFWGKVERFRPVILGGVPRRHRMHNAFVNQACIQRVVKLADEGKLRVPLDSVIKMEDGKKVC